MEGQLRQTNGRRVDGCHEEMAFTARTAALGEQDAVLQERLDEVARQNGEAIHPIDKKNEHPMLSIGCLGEEEVALIHILYHFIFFSVFVFWYLLLILMSNKTQQAVGTRQAIEQLRDTMASETGKFLGGAGHHMLSIENHNKIYDDLCTNSESWNYIKVLKYWHQTHMIGYPYTCRRLASQACHE